MTKIDELIKKYNKESKKCTDMWDEYEGGMRYMAKKIVIDLQSLQEPTESREVKINKYDGDRLLIYMMGIRDGHTMGYCTDGYLYTIKKEKEQKGLRGKNFNVMVVDEIVD